MNCLKHKNRESVGQCSECGAAVCSACAEATAEVRESCGVLCVDCYCRKLSELRSHYEGDRKKRLKRAIISIVCYALGLFLLLGGIVRADLVPIAIGVVLCGFYTGLTWRKAAQESHEEYEREHGITVVVRGNKIEREDGFLMKIIFFIIGTVLGLVITPIRVIIDFVTFSKLKKDIARVDGTIARTQRAAA